jgi:hypothetical protein
VFIAHIVFPSSEIMKLSLFLALLSGVFCMDLYISATGTGDCLSRATACSAFTSAAEAAGGLEFDFYC